MARKEPPCWPMPRSVALCKKLPHGAKVLMCDIIDLCKRDGHCWASNNYFASRYKVHINTITQWVKALSKNGFIFSYINRNMAYTTRKIYLRWQIWDEISRFQEMPEHLRLLREST